MSSVERWKPIAVNPNYEVSSFGRVRRVTHGKGVKRPGLLKIHRDRGGYCWAQLGDKIRAYVASLVAVAFIGARPKGYEIDHVDGSQTNNTPSNLEYVTHSENVKRAVVRGTIKPPKVRGESHGQAKLTNSDIRKIRMMLGPQRGIAKRFNTDQGTVSRIKNRRLWGHVV